MMIESREGDALPPTFFSLQERKDKSKHAGQTNSLQGGDRPKEGTTLQGGSEVLQDCVSFLHEAKKIAYLLSNQEVIAW